MAQTEHSLDGLQDTPEMPALFIREDARPFEWAIQFDEMVMAALLRGDHDALIHYRDRGQPAALGAPSRDHYLPMLYVLGMQEAGEPLTFVHEGMQNGSVSMRCFKIG